MTAPPSIGLIGCGHWGAYILRDLVELGCRVGVVARTEDSVRRAREGGAAYTRDTLEALGPMDGYVVATPAQSHAAILDRLLDRPAPIFVEKPLCTRSADGHRLAPKARGRVFCMDKWRYHPGILWLAHCVAEARLGPVQGLYLTRVGGVSRSRVNAIWHLMPHDLAITLEILGALPPARAAMAATLGDGWAYHAHAVLGDRPWVVIDAGERRGRHFREVRLACAEGEATLGGGYAEAIIVRRHSASALGAPERVPIEQAMPLEKELAAFLGFLQGGAPPKSSYDEALVMVERLETLQRLAGIDPDALRDVQTT
jgi:predicted dehydrogenase